MITNIKQIITYIPHRNRNCILKVSRRTGLLESKTYFVYRIISPGNRIPIGEIEERRRAERGNNAEDVLRLAKKLYSSSTLEAMEIHIEPAGRLSSATPGGRDQR